MEAGAHLLLWLWNLTFKSWCCEKEIFSWGGCGVSPSRFLGICLPSNDALTCTR